MKYVACYGDSLVQGFPFGPRYSWTAQVEKLTQIKMLNYGVCGDCCDDIIYRMRQYALPEYVETRRRNYLMSKNTLAFSMVRLAASSYVSPFIRASLLTVCST